VIQGERTLAGRYQIGRRIGRGGMAEVYAATDERLGRHVAVKLLHTNLAGETSFRSRFRQEAQAAARMTHPTIVRVFDAGEDTFVRADGFEIVVPYIVMEYIDGRQLGDLMAESPLSDQKIEKYMSGLLTSLEYSHRAGVVHRDIKPANVMITTSDDVKVTDFGIARAISDTAGTIAQTTAILGTASYFSPEQARGETVDGRSDLYSAGIVLYEMLTGRVPFQGDSAVAVAYQHVTEPPRKPSELSSRVTPALEAVVMKALAKRADDRYQTAAEFRSDLERAFQGVAPAYTRQVAEDSTPTELFGAGPTAVDATESALNSMNDDDDRAPQVQRRPPAMWIWGAVALVAAVVIGVLLWVLLLQPTQLPETSATVPDLVGMTEEEATATVEDLGLNARVETQSSDEVEAGEVIAQSPPEGSSVGLDTTVTLTVSSGPDAVAVPSLDGMSETEATAALEELGLKSGSITREDSADIPADQVIRSEPSTGQSVAPGTKVDIYVSTGNVTLPDLQGENLADAEATLSELGLTPVHNELTNCPAVDGNPIVNMTVAPGPVAQGSEVGLSYCAGSAPEPDPQPSDDENGGNGGGGSGGGNNGDDNDAEIGGND
jgi:serine/threonine-protein kinase